MLIYLNVMFAILLFPNSELEARSSEREAGNSL